MVSSSLVVTSNSNQRGNLFSDRSGEAVIVSQQFQAYLSDIERGRSSPSLTMMVDLAVGLEIHLVDLVKPMKIEGVKQVAGRKRPRED